MFYNTKEAERVKNISPLYKVGEIVNLNTWVGEKYDFKVVDIQVIYHYNILYLPFRKSSISFIPVLACFSDTDLSNKINLSSTINL